MGITVKLKKLLLFLGDIAVLYLSLAVVLLLRYGNLGEEIARSHFKPFSFVFIFWVITFYVGDLYELRVLKNSIEFTKKLGVALGISSLITILFFYFIPGFAIAPKTNLFLFIVIVGIIGYLWRRLYNQNVIQRMPMNNILLIGYNQTAQELADHLKDHPQLGYKIKLWMKEGLQDKQFKDLAELIKKYHIDTIMMPAHIKKSSRAAKLLYKNMVSGVRVVDLAHMYESIFKKIPLAEIEEVWFLENLTKPHKMYDSLKRPIEIIGVVLFGILTLPITVLIALSVFLSSQGSVIFTQKRMGLRGRLFAIHKFRTMKTDAEKDGPQWAKKQDARATPLGQFLRRTHLDEFPQLVNILKGNLSFIGPRPERPEFVELLTKEIPYYELRHLIRPGITGWAQTHYPYGASVEDAYEKLQYDIYYLKHRSVLLDILVILKTLKFFFRNL